MPLSRVSGSDANRICPQAPRFSSNKFLSRVTEPNGTRPPITRDRNLNVRSNTFPERADKRGAAMTTVKNQLIELNHDTRRLVTYARNHSDVSDQLVSRIDDLNSDMSRAIEEYAFLTASAVDDLRASFEHLQQEVSLTIQAAAFLLHDGQLHQAEALEEAGGKIQFGLATKGILIGVGAAIGGAAIGVGLLAGAAIVGRAIAAAGDRIGGSIEGSDQRRQQLLIQLIARLEANRPYLTFKYIGDVAQSQEIYSRDEARRTLQCFLDDGLLAKYRHGDIKALRLNRDHQLVRKLVDHPASSDLT